MDKKKILLVGGGAHCKSCIEVIESTDKFEIVGIIEQEERIGESILGYKVIGCDDDLEKFREQYLYVHISIGDLKIRKKLIKKVKELKFELPIILANSAIISKYSKIGNGTIIMHHSVLNSDSKIGSNCIINTKALIEHDGLIGNNCHISTGAIVNGSSIIGNDCFIGSHATVNDKLTIVDECIIGSGTTIYKSIEEKGVYYGNPIKKKSDV